MSASAAPPRDDSAGYEKRDLDPRTIALFTAGSAVVLLFAAGLAFVMVKGAIKRHAVRQAPPAPVQARAGTAEPRLQVDGFKDLREMRAGEERALNSYGWVDRDAGIVRMPVERAMEIIAEKGLPTRTAETVRGEPSGVRREPKESGGRRR